MVDILRNTGVINPWIDILLIAGKKWREQVEESIIVCDVFLYALTPESVQSEWCQWEFAKAVELGKPVVPVLMQAKTKLPKIISDIQYVDLTDGLKAEAVAKLTVGIMSRNVKLFSVDVPMPTEVPLGPPPQAIDTITEETKAQLTTVKVEVDSEDDETTWEEYREELIDELVRQLLYIQENGEILHFGKFNIKVDRYDTWSPTIFLASVDVSPYSEFIEIGPVELKNADHLLPDERKKRLSIQKRYATQAASKEIEVRNKKKLLSLGWDRATTTKAWNVTKNVSVLSQIAAELVDAQHEIFKLDPSVDDIKTWPE